MLIKKTVTPVKFDQVVKGNVIIKPIGNKKYEITFTKIGKFLLYQVWSADNSIQQNENRSVKYVNAKEWVKLFLETNTKLKDSNKPLFTPTTVMEIGYKKYLFVINKAKLNKDGHVVFEVSTKEIKLSDDTSKELLKIQHGHYKNVRFDIDCLLLKDIYSGFFTYLGLTFTCSNPVSYGLGGGFEIIIQLNADGPETCSFNGNSLYIVINTDTNEYYVFDIDFATNYMQQEQLDLYNALQASLPNGSLGTFYSSIVAGYGS
jgi:hypothetical protein